MRKAIAAFLALMLVASSAAIAEPAWMDYDCGHFTISFPEDIDGYIDDEIVSNQPFVMLYQDYDANATFNKSLNVVWSSELLDLAAADPDLYAQQILDVSIMTYEMLGITVTDPVISFAEFGDMLGKPMLSFMYRTTMDYSGLGIDEQWTLYTVQVMVPDEAFEGTYTFTLTTDDWSDTRLLMDVSNSIVWNN